MIYTYACKNAIHTSKQVINKIKNNGNQKVPDKKTQVPIIPHKKEIKIFNNVCPDIIFANRRIDKLNTLAIYDTISINIKIKEILFGIPAGK